jgi:hypothetical protein
MGVSVYLDLEWSYVRIAQRGGWATTTTTATADIWCRWYVVAGRFIDEWASRYEQLPVGSDSILQHKLTAILLHLARVRELFPALATAALMFKALAIDLLAGRIARSLACGLLAASDALGIAAAAWISGGAILARISCSSRWVLLQV